ncbi:hypothetical protein [Mycoplasma feriruminatoris]|uniref:HNH endonuclease n=1 Tax=Mycoplasma feriruminatoris TaxID=1179777 RepID=A0AAQ3HYH4_9MOLU|nr:hypothetical protein [Mycoplasma feriruminatoris]WFQ94936.1 HNH endonuclease [Mycoplasma feriruminatoris]
MDKTKNNNDSLFYKFSKSTKRCALFKYFKDFVFNHLEQKITTKETYKKFIQQLNGFLQLYIKLKFPENFNDIGSNEWLIAIRNKDIHFFLVFYLYDKYYSLQAYKWEEQDKSSKANVIKYIEVFSSHIIKVISVHKDSRLSLFDLTYEFIDMIKHNKKPEEIKIWLESQSNDNSTRDGVIFNTPSKKDFLDSCKAQIITPWISYSLAYIIQISLEKKKTLWQHYGRQNYTNCWTHYASKLK